MERSVIQGDIAESVRDAARNAPARADELGRESLVIPAMDCGVAGSDISEGARLIAEVLAASDFDDLRDVRLIGYGDEEYERIRAAAEGGSRGVTGNAPGPPAAALDRRRSQLRSPETYKNPQRQFVSGE
jgi:O-acetyl-ADP-ribose deacetylase (regulator of RNase III)